MCRLEITDGGSQQTRYAQHTQGQAALDPLVVGSGLPERCSHTTSADFKWDFQCPIITTAH